MRIYNRWERAGFAIACARAANCVQDVWTLEWECGGIDDARKAVRSDSDMIVLCAWLWESARFNGSDNMARLFGSKI